MTDWVTEALADADIPGAAVSVVHGGEEVVSAGYGDATVEGEAVDPARTAFFAGSTAKLFTTAAVLRLVEAGALDLDRDVNDYLTSFHIHDTHSGRPVTLRHLLTHTGGFDPDYGLFGSADPDPARLPDLAESLAAWQPDRVNPPGEVIAYDNYGVALAGHIAAEAAGLDYPALVEREVFTPLGMSHTSAAQPAPPGLAATTATGHRPDGAGGQTVVPALAHPWAPTGPGQLTTATDMGRFMIDQLSDVPVLGDTATTGMTTGQFRTHPDAPGLTFMYEEGTTAGHRSLFKSGDVPGFHSAVTLFPEVELGVFVVVNGDGNGDFDIRGLAAAVASAIPAPDTGEAETVRDTDSGHLAGDYLSTRLPGDSVLRAQFLGSPPVSVVATGDGGLITSGITLSSRADATTQRWRPIGPDLFQEVDGTATIAFGPDGVLTGSLDQSQVYQRVGWWRSPALHLWLLLGAGLTGVVAALWFPVAALIARRRGERHPIGARLARLSATAAGVLVGLLLYGFASLTADPAAASEAMVTGAFSVKVLMVIATLVGAFAVAVAGFAVAAWCRRWWRPAGRAGLTIVAVALSITAAVLFEYEMTGPPFV
ncbi:serine hydrolase domain-containing protein [Stackebrandtia albiflava]|uniref:serine hydrolase domain-containing protein n=1 Tax=Stackebrandtia albiflava TaxID=406432 RepID=UPI0011BD6DEF|nr:serine hydrolase domain-containing protein [Stackebrandtia albiflava]